MSEAFKQWQQREAPPVLESERFVGRPVPTLLQSLRKAATESTYTARLCVGLFLFVVVLPRAVAFVTGVDMPVAPGAKQKQARKRRQRARRAVEAEPGGAAGKPKPKPAAVAAAPLPRPPGSAASAARDGPALLHETNARLIVPPARGGCPWTDERTAADLVRYCRDELDEAEAALTALARLEGPMGASGDPEAVRAARQHLQDEIGDVVFTATLLSRVAARDLGTDDDATYTGAAKKVRRRTPYMDWDGAGAAGPGVTSADASEAWAKAKAEERRRAGVVEAGGDGGGGGGGGDGGPKDKDV